MTSTVAAPSLTGATNPGQIVSDAVDRCLEIAQTWLGWDGRPVHRGENVWTPHKALRRITDHLLDHLAKWRRCSPRSRRFRTAGTAAR